LAGEQRVKKAKINTKDLVQKIEKITKDRIVKEDVVSLKDFRGLKKKDNPPVLLIIEDDETMRLAMTRLFQNEGFVVKAVADGTELGRVLDDTPMDLIILDVGLPWLNGFELAQLLKEHEDLKNIPLIFVTGKNSEFEIKKGFQLGADDYITKPFENEKILKSVRTLLKLTE
jgi:two-component system aerobic respiration control protein ArcA